jgi:uncharacterized protein (DUF1330 family)
MTAYAVGRFHEIEMGPAIVEYLQKIDDTLAPFDGRFLVHGARPIVLEGAWTEDFVVIAFPDLPSAQAWYESPAYQRILSLRLPRAKGDVILIDGVAASHRATDILSAA